MPETPSEWLRQQRLSRGWPVPEMGRRLRAAARAVGDPLPENHALCAMIRRWERGSGISERDRLHYCRVFGITLRQYASDQAGSARLASAGAAATAHTADRPGGTPLPASANRPVGPGMASAPGVAYGGSQAPDSGGSAILQEVLMAAHEGGEHARATRHYLAGSVLIEIPGEEGEAAAELDRAAGLYAAGPGPGEQYGYGVEGLTWINLATARLRAGALDAAAVASEPVLSLPPAKRVAALAQCFGRVRYELAQPIYRGSAQAGEPDERIEDFCRETVVADLLSLPGPV